MNKHRKQLSFYRNYINFKMSELTFCVILQPQLRLLCSRNGIEVKSF